MRLALRTLRVARCGGAGEEGVPEANAIRDVCHAQWCERQKDADHDASDWAGWLESSWICQKGSEFVAI